MVRKTKEDTQQTYDALLDAAERIFCEKGVSNTTLNDVACAAGMTRGAIYWHFKDKKELFHALCDRAFMPMEILLNEISSASSEDPIASIKKLYVHFIEQASNNSRQSRVFDIIFHRCEKTAEMESFVEEREGKRECLRQVQSLFDQAVKINILPPETDTWIAVQITHSFLIGVVHEWLLDPKAYDLASYGEAMIDCVLAGLIAKPPLHK